MNRVSIRRLLSLALWVACPWCVEDSASIAATSVRVATYNASLSRSSEGRLVNDLSTTTNLQARRVAEIIQRVRPDVLLINEFDFDAAGAAAQLFQQNYLAVAQDTAATGTAAVPIAYPYRFLAESNTGVGAGTDFDGDGADDDYGFGTFPGQYGMVVYSRLPIDEDQLRTFRTFLWRDMPGNQIPDNYTQDGIDHARLSSKSHWDVPILVADQTVHLLASHPTPPVFDDAVFDENGRRNADEIRFWTDYIDPASSAYIYDDAGTFGGLPAGTRFVIAGDQNADPLDGDSRPGAADPLVMSAWINHDQTPSSEGGVERSTIEGGINASHAGNPAFDTADFGAPGNLRVDYVLPSANMQILGSGVFWPTRSAPRAPLIAASDHRLVYVDVAVPEPATGMLLAIGLVIVAAARRRPVSKAMYQTQAERRRSAVGRSILSALTLGLTGLSSFAAETSQAAPGTADGRQGPRLLVGTARIDITPDYPVRLSGYGGRREEADVVAQRIWAKALAIGTDATTAPAVLLSVENCGVPDQITKHVAAQLQAQVALPSSHLVICSTHTHSAPCLTGFAPLLFGAPLPPEHQQHVDRYSGELPDKLVRVALAAIARRREARLTWGTGSVGFAANRRVLKDGRWSGFGVQADQPVDHRLPVLVARDPQGQLIAIVANYACHCTTLGGDFNQICGDWAGYAQELIEANHPGALALITIGCGADADPEPRGGLAMCKRHGRSLAAEVERLLERDLQPVAPPIECQCQTIDLPFAELPDKEEWQRCARQDDIAGYHARQFLARLEEGRAIARTLSYPVATWTFSDDLAMVFLGGEVVVDYAIRMRAAFAADHLWITAYANDVPCYIPSKRILGEGGYEADFSMLYYARPTRFDAKVEDLVVESVGKLLPARFHSPAAETPAGN